MWQVFYGTGDDDPVYYLHDYDDRDEAEWFAEDKYWDLRKCFGAYAVAVNLYEKQATIWGDFIPFAGEFDADFRDDPEFFGPRQKPLSALSFFDINKPLRDFWKSLAENAKAENQLLSRLREK